MKQFKRIEIILIFIFVLSSITFVFSENPVNAQSESSIFDDFSAYPLGTIPAGWTQYGTSVITPTIVNYGGTGTVSQRLEFPAYTAQATSKWLIKDGSSATVFTSTVKLNFQTNSDGSGIILAWNDEGNYIAVLPNPFWDEIVVWEFANGQTRSAQSTGRYTVPIETGQDYWLRIVTNITQDQENQIMVFWSTDGITYHEEMVVQNLYNLTGKVGVGTYQLLSHTLFDDFSVEKSAPYSISGQVTDIDNNPIADATVSIPSGITVTTDANGVYTITNLTDDLYEVIATKDGYEFWPTSQKVTIGPDATNVDFTEWACKIDAPLYLQGQPSTPISLINPQWADHTYGNYSDGDSTNTIGRWGCNTASNAMAISYFSQEKQHTFATNPDLLNSWLRNHEGYNVSNGVKYSMVSDYAKENGVDLTIDALEPANNQVLDQNLCAGDPAMLKVNGGHFVLSTGKVNIDGHVTYTLNDPSLGHTTLYEDYNNTYSSAYYYTDAADDSSFFEVSAHSPVHIILTDPDGRKLGFDPRTNTTWDEIPNAGYFTETITTVDGSSLPEAKVLLVSRPEIGEYDLDVIGFDEGSYVIQVSGIDKIGDVYSNDYSGEAQANSVDNYSFDVDEGELPPTLNPVSTIFNGDGAFTHLTNASRVRIHNNHAYIASPTDDAITIVDITAPVNPQLVLEMSAAAGYSGLNAIADFYIDDRDYLYIVSHSPDQLAIYDIQNPTAPVLLSQAQDGDGEFSTLAGPRGVFVQNNIAYVTSIGDDALTIIDVSDPLDPNLLSVYSDPGYFTDPMHLYVDGNYAFVPTEYSQRVFVIDISDPTNPTVLSILIDDLFSPFLDRPTFTFVKDNTLYISAISGIVIADVTDPANPIKLSEIYDGDGQFEYLQHVYGIWVEDDYLYAVASQDRALTVIDVSDKTNPTLVAWARDEPESAFTHLNNPNHVTVDGDYIYVTSYLEHAMTVISFNSSFNNMLVASTENSEIYPWDLVNIDLDIQGAVDLYANQTTCSIDPVILESQSSSLGDFFDPVNRLVLLNEIDAITGTMSMAISQQNPAGSISGNGRLATFTFQGLNPGTTTITCDTNFSNRDGFTQLSDFTPTEVTVLPFATITGTATYQGHLTHADIDLIATGPVTSTDVADNNGHFALSELRTGTYTITADAVSYLPSCMTTTIISGEIANLPTTTLYGGDVNDDGIINIGDATLLGGNFGLNVPPGASQADINGDNIINVQDLAILGGNYEQAGCQEW